MCWSAFILLIFMIIYESYLPECALAQQPLLAIWILHDLNLTRLDLPVIQLQLMQNLRNQAKKSTSDVWPEEQVIGAANVHEKCP